MRSFKQYITEAKSEINTYKDFLKPNNIKEMINAPAFRSEVADWAMEIDLNKKDFNYNKWKDGMLSMVLSLARNSEGNLFINKSRQKEAEIINKLPKNIGVKLGEIYAKAYVNSFKDKEMVMKSFSNIKDWVKN